MADIPTVEVKDANEVNQATVIVELEGLIKNYVTKLEKLQDELRKTKEMFDSAFENDETYRNHDKVAKEAAKQRSQTRSEIMKQSVVAELNEKFKDLRLSTKEIKNTLSDYLQEYAKLSGSTEIEDENGTIRDIVYEARLVKRANNNS